MIFDDIRTRGSQKVQKFKSWMFHCLQKFKSSKVQHGFVEKVQKFKSWKSSNLAQQKVQKLKSWKSSSLAEQKVQKFKSSTLARQKSSKVKKFKTSPSLKVQKFKSWIFDFQKFKSWIRAPPHRKMQSSPPLIKNGKPINKPYTLNLKQTLNLKP